MTLIHDPVLNREFDYDVGNKITGWLDNEFGREVFTFDKLNRLKTQATLNIEYDYDYNGNRTVRETKSNTVKTTVEKTSNRLSELDYDTSGRVIRDATRAYVYDENGRTKQIDVYRTDSTQPDLFPDLFMSASYNAQGQRVTKKVWGNIGTGIAHTDITFVYDEAGKLIGEYDETGAMIREYIYLGNLPVAMLTHERPGEILQIHTDHLGTPRAVTDTTGKVLWQWEGDMFGDVEPQIAEIKQPLRMAGQYHDAETGLFYNYFRYYDPKAGRYLRPDPIGLAGGMNPYVYVGGNPVMAVDPLGLWPTYVPMGQEAADKYVEELERPKIEHWQRQSV